jgi:hypothetical protein
MSSRFEQFFVSYAMPVLRREFNQLIYLATRDCQEFPVQCMMDLEEITSTQGNPEVQGRISIKVADLLAYIERPHFGNLITATIGGQVFDIYAEMTEQFDSIVFNVKRKFDEQKITNLFDLHGNQIPYAEEL